MSQTHPTIEQCLVSSITLIVETNRNEYAVEHGADDLNYPEESFPRSFERVTNIDDNETIPAHDVYGNNNIFTRANAFIDRHTQKSVPAHHEKASSADGVSLMSTTVRVTTGETRYKLQYGTDSRFADDGLVIPLQMAWVLDETMDDGRRQIDPLDVPEAVEEQGRASVVQTIAR